MPQRSHACTFMRRNLSIQFGGFPIPHNQLSEPIAADKILTVRRESNLTGVARAAVSTEYLLASQPNALCNVIHSVVVGSCGRTSSHSMVTIELSMDCPAMACLEGCNVSVGILHALHDPHTVQEESSDVRVQIGVLDVLDGHRRIELPHQYLLVIGSTDKLSSLVKEGDGVARTCTGMRGLASRKETHTEVIVVFQDHFSRARIPLNKRES